MRIGVDALGIQSPYSAGRGIGRYARAFLSNLLEIDQTNHYVLYAYEDLDQECIPRSSRSELQVLRRQPDRHEHNYQFVADRVARTNPDHLDWLLVLSPFETWQFYGVPAKPLNGLKVASILYDLIPFLFQEVYLREPHVSAWFHGHLQRLRTHDLLLSISEATRRDALNFMRLREERVVTIGAASDHTFFRPATHERESEVDRGLRERIGVRSPYLFCLGSSDSRKNLDGLFRAFAAVSEETRSAVDLVVTCALSGEERERTIRQAEECGIASRVILTGEIDDLTLRALYRGSLAFAFPSIYEGFGLPILEAMHCGTPVIAGRNSSQPEVVGDAGLLVEVNDAAELARAIEKLVRDSHFAEQLGERARTRAEGFRWKEVAKRTLEALEASKSVEKTHGKLRVALKRKTRPHLACFSPLPPARSGVADYTDRLVRSLKSDYRVDLYHDPGQIPDLDMESDEYGCRPADLFPRYSDLGIYGSRLLHQMGNAHYHHAQYTHLLAKPSVVVLHDFCLAGFHYGFERLGLGQAGYLSEEVRFCHPERWEEFEKNEGEWKNEPGGLPEALARREFWLNRRVLEQARSVIFHSDWCRERVAEMYPELLGRTHVVPMGALARQVSRAERAEARRRLGIGKDEFVFCSVGILHPVKMNVESLAAFAGVAKRYPKARMIFAGRDLGEGEAKAAVERLGIESRVRFLGHCGRIEYERAIWACDVGVCLRRPPTKGETSAALIDILRHGRPAIVCDVGSFSGWPDNAVAKVVVKGDDQDIERIRNVFEQVLECEGLRAEMSRHAFERVLEHHSWERVAKTYRSIIEGQAA